MARLADGTTLSEAEAEACIAAMMDGTVPEPVMAGFLMALRVRGETEAEITGAARAMRSRALRVEAPQHAIDTCGTGGDGSGTVNISTGAAIVAASCGAVVAKHGNRAQSSKSGSADVLAALGVTLDASPETVAHCIREAGIGFLFAPAHHSAMRHVGPVRKALGVRTLFNLLGPLSNPANTRRQVLGVFNQKWVEPMAHVLHALGATNAWVVHGHGGLDELALEGPSTVAVLRDGGVSTTTVTPESVGLTPAPLATLKVDSAEASAVALRAAFGGAPGPVADVLALNAGAALVVAGLAVTLEQGVGLAKDSLAAGKPLETLDHLVRLSGEQRA